MTSNPRHGLTEHAADAAIDQACRMLRLPTIRAQFPGLADAAAREQMSYRAFIAELLMAECDDRARRRSERRIKAAGFPREKSLRTFDFDANPNIDPAVINTLATCDWVKKGLPLCLIGDSGTGKSHLLIALGTEAAMGGYRVRYTLAAKLVNELVEAADDRQLTKTINRYGRVDLVCIDELGYMELDRRGAELLFQVLTEKRGKGQRRHRLQRVVQRLDQDLHRPSSVRRHRRPAHLRRQHHRDRHGLLPPRPHARRPARLAPTTAMPRTCLDTTDAIELAETLQFITGWLTTDPATLAPSFLAYTGHPAYGLDTLRADLDRFAFLLGGNDGEFLTGQDPP
jgi:DNA replication protein DnaC